MTILAIETSCDETSASVCKQGKIISNIIASQLEHSKYGGVIPEIASRAHTEKICSVAQEAIATAEISINDIDAVAYTKSPGLIGCLLVGAQFAKGLAFALNKPLIGVHHMQAHVLANLIPEQRPSFPFICLTVSGGHTQIVLAHAPLNLELLGETIDDAAGEAFDKAAKMLGLPYPGGPMIDRYAKEGNPLAFPFAQPNIAGLNFSFSGFKTSVLYFLKKQEPTFIQENLNDLCASIQHNIIAILLKKLEKAVLQTRIRTVCLAGGVSANSGLRQALLNMGKQKKWTTFIPPFEFCTDNAAMIGITANYKFIAKQFDTWDSTPSASGHWAEIEKIG